MYLKFYYTLSITINYPTALNEFIPSAEYVYRTNNTNIEAFFTLHEKQHFRKNAERKSDIFVIFCIWRKYIFGKTKIKENIIFSIVSDIFCNKSIKQDKDKKEKNRGLNTLPRWWEI